jgi:hypothetical protein
MGYPCTHTLALAFVLCSRLSTAPECDPFDGAAAWLGFFETVEEDMIVESDREKQTR